MAASHRQGICQSLRYLIDRSITRRGPNHNRLGYSHLSKVYIHSQQYSFHLIWPKVLFLVTLSPVATPLLWLTQSGMPGQFPLPAGCPAGGRIIHHEDYFHTCMTWSWHCQQVPGSEAVATGMPSIDVHSYTHMSLVRVPKIPHGSSVWELMVDEENMRKMKRLSIHA